MRWRLLVAGLLSWSLTGVASAHGVGRPASGAGVGLVVAVVGVVVAGTAGGVAATRGRRGRRRVARLVALAAGPVLVAVGATLVVTVVRRRPSVAVVSLAGVGAGLFLAIRSDCSGCADATVTVVAVHRLLEGVALSIAAAVGSTLALAGAVALAAHAAGECAAVGVVGRPDARWRGVRAVAALQVAFVAGVLVGSVVPVGLPPAVRLSAFALAGGALVTLGLYHAKRGPADASSRPSLRVEGEYTDGRKP